jgi:hypothetical protein
MLVEGLSWRRRSEHNSSGRHRLVVVDLVSTLVEGIHLRIDSLREGSCIVEDMESIGCSGGSREIDMVRVRQETRGMNQGKQRVLVVSQDQHFQLQRAVVVVGFPVVADLDAGERLLEHKSYHRESNLGLELSDD